MDFFTKVIMAILSLDTIRAIIAMLGWVKPDSKIAWLIYGRYDRNLIRNALEDLGFSNVKQDRIIKNMRELANDAVQNSGVKKEEAATQLIVLLAKYIVKFQSPIQYGGKKLTKSNYYIDTMEISHYPDDKKIMATIMMHLICSDESDTKKPDIIVTPKGGNPLFAQEVANVLNADLLIAKSSSDKSKISMVGNDPKMLFKINYEGSWNAIDARNQAQCIVLDCNTSGGSQLLEIISDIRHLINKGKNNIAIQNPQDVYVLFRADNEGDEIDKKFEDRNCHLIRFFDLDEDIKTLLYAFRERCEKEGRKPDFYFQEDVDEASTILEKIKKKGKLYYSIGEN